ncbi:NADPH-dependent FMN reductase [Variovorax sp. VNK109]|uniref:NADPH-dependent FMN reductase n=1 Tax=Variovorax sp. VNK109 TaxID=3400919 RepID=UPI003BFAAD44
MSVLLIAGSPSERSRSAALLDAVSQRIAAHGAAIDRLLIRDLSPQALLLADVAHRSVLQAIDQVERARTIVVATPVYKAAYSGVLKLFLDVLPQSAFKGKAVLPLATGGSPHHMLALDYALRPVLQSLASRHILPGIYATDAQVTLTPEGAYTVDGELSRRLDDAVENLAMEGHLSRSSRAVDFTSATAGFEPVPFSRVRCSV